MFEDKYLDLNRVEVIIEEFTPKIKKSLQNTDYNQREDLEQEIKLKMIEKLQGICIEDTPGFFQFINYYKKN